MKKWLFFKILLLVFMCSGCAGGGSDDPYIPEQKPPQETDKVTITTTDFAAAAAGGNINITFSTNATWTASSSESWCVLSTNSGQKGNATLVASVTENTSQNERKATIVIQAGTDTKTVTITQGAKDNITIPITNFAATADSANVNITFSTNVAWTAASSESWCTLSANSGEKGTVTLTASVAENTSQNERKATIVIQAGTDTKTVTITQGAKDNITIPITNFASTADGGNVNITFSTNAAWTAASSESWCTLSANSGEKGTVTLTVSVAENTSQNDRKAIIVILAGTDTKTVTITQVARDKDKITITTTDFAAAAAGGNINITFSTNAAWTAASSESWCILSANSGQKGNATLVASVAENTSQNERKATITIKAGTDTKTITITQKGKTKPDNNSGNPGGNIGDMNWGN